MFPPSVSVHNFLYSLHESSDDRSEEDHNPHEDTLHSEPHARLNVDMITLKVFVVRHHPVNAIGADREPGRSSVESKRSGSDNNITAAPILDYGEISRS